MKERKEWVIISIQITSTPATTIKKAFMTKLKFIINFNIFSLCNYAHDNVQIYHNDLLDVYFGETHTQSLWQLENIR